jgi:Glycosyl hydrolases family 16
MPPQETSGLLATKDKTVGGGNYEGIIVSNHNNINNNGVATTILPHSHQLSFGSSDSGGDGSTENTYSCCRKQRMLLPLATLVAAAIVVAKSGKHFVSQHKQPQQPQQQQQTVPQGDKKSGVSSENDHIGMSNDTAASSSDVTAESSINKKNFTGPYKLLEAHQGESFLDYYDFYEGADSLGSAGFNTYVSQQRAMEIGLVQVVHIGDDDDDEESSSSSSSSSSHSSILLQSAPTEAGPRESIRLEGKSRYKDRGLFVLDLDHMPTGCGVWPAVWLTDEDAWPNHGEIDFVEGINDLSVAKTALHTSDRCSMYAHVPWYSKSGYWDDATGIPNTWTGQPDYNTRVEADNCWVMAPHQWANQGCVAISSQNGTLGAPLNDAGGGVFALEWDPANHYIRSWVFPKSDGIPANLQDSISSASAAAGETRTTTSTAGDNMLEQATVPDTDTWGLPYAYFAIGETTGCSADHFQNMRLVINLAFCGTVSGNRYFTDCPTQANQFNVSNDPVLSCNAWIQSQPQELDEAYFKIRGVYVYEREKQ